MGYSPWGCKTIGHNLATKQQQMPVREPPSPDTCSEDWPGMGGKLSERGPLCVLFSLHGPVNIYQTLAVPSPGELPSSALKSQSPTPNTLFCL